MTTPGPEARPPAPEAPYAVKLPIFEGPLDLLLHLIRLNEVDIADIPIAEIAQQYVEYLNFLHELNLDVAGEYLLMAATLAWIKSRMLLPPSEEETEDEGMDPRAELVARLLEYQRFKEAAEQIGERSLLGRDVFAALPLEPDARPDAEREIEVGLVQLLEAFRRVLQGARAAVGRHEVEVETVTVRERMFAVMELLQQAESIELEELFGLESGRPPSRALLVATFLAILELVRVAALRVYQGVNEDWVPEGPIRLRTAEAGAAWRERISDVT